MDALESKKAELNTYFGQLKDSYSILQSNIAQLQGQMQDTTNELIRTEAQLQLIEVLQAPPPEIPESSEDPTPESDQE